MTINRAKILAVDVLARGFNFRFKVSGNSMRPLIRDGDTLIMHKSKIVPFPQFWSSEIYLASAQAKVCYFGFTL